MMGLSDHHPATEEVKALSRLRQKLGFHEAYGNSSCDTPLFDIALILSLEKAKLVKRMAL